MLFSKKRVTYVGSTAVPIFPHWKWMLFFFFFCFFLFLFFVFFWGGGGGGEGRVFCCCFLLLFVLLCLLVFVVFFFCFCFFVVVFLFFFVCFVVVVFFVFFFSENCDETDELGVEICDRSLLAWVKASIWLSYKELYVCMKVASVLYGSICSECLHLVYSEYKRL